MSNIQLESNQFIQSDIKCNILGLDQIPIIKSSNKSNSIIPDDVSNTKLIDSQISQYKIFLWRWI